jgi:hypothetical protein
MAEQQLHAAQVAHATALQDYCSLFNRSYVVRNWPTDSECAICYNSMAGSTAKISPCTHVFHSGCLATWSRTQNNQLLGATCPLCRQSLQGEPPDESEISSSSSSSSSSITTDDESSDQEEEDGDNSRWGRVKTSIRGPPLKKRKLNSAEGIGVMWKDDPELGLAVQSNIGTP